MSNQHHRRDDNHQEIVNGLRSRGFSVFDISQVDGGAGDILVGKANQTWLFEIKNPEKGTTLTTDERKFKDSWKGQWAIITSVQEALEVMNAVGTRPTHPKIKPCYNYRYGFNCVYHWRLTCHSCQYRQGVRI